MSVSPQQHLDEHYGDVGFHLVKSSDAEPGGGMSKTEARSFLRGLRPVLKAGKTLAEAAKKLNPKG